MKMVLASDNAGKLREFREILTDCGIELLSKRDCGCAIEVEENGATFAENAYLKAAAVCRATGLPAIADDSGLCVDALGGAPGLNSARFTGSHADSDADRYNLLLRLMEGAAERSARFVCAVCCVLPDGTLIQTEGECLGEITREPAGHFGFGYSPVFRAQGYERTMSEMTDEEKNAISHRGKALDAFKAEWEKRYAQQ